MGIHMTPKPFSVGTRIEHLRENIDRSQYGAAHAKLPAAYYKQSVHLKDGRGVYTFCMCPGGVVVAAQSEKDSVVTNGMSEFARDKINSNDGYAYRVAASNSNKSIASAENYSLLSLIDASGTIDFERGGLGENKCLFRSGDTFSFSQSKYQRYFPNGDCFNDGSTSNVTVSFDSVTNTQATISFAF